MEMPQEMLIRSLGFGSREHVAVVGGGGKTTLCFALAEALRQTGAKVVSTTTTKVWRKEAQAFPKVVLMPIDRAKPEGLLETLKTWGGVFVTPEFLDSGKAEGIPPEFSDEMFSNTGVDYVIIEADGAAGRPLKTPADHEPVIPATVTMVIAVMGLNALGEVLSPDVVFRLDRFTALTGLKEGDLLTSERLVKAFQSEEGLFKNTPSSARRVVFLNQLDILKDEAPARDLARKLMSTYPSLDRVVLASIQEKRFVTLKPGGE